MVKGTAYTHVHTHVTVYIGRDTHDWFLMVAVVDGSGNSRVAKAVVASAMRVHAGFGGRDNAWLHEAWWICSTHHRCFCGVVVAKGSLHRATRGH